MTLGIETMNKIVKMKILILGLRGLGIETAKNIILLGPKEVQIYDPEIVKINDLGSNFYLNEEDVGKKRRDEASISQLSELNSYVHVSMMKGDIFENIRKFNVVVITEMMNREKLEQIDEICRENNIAFIYACSLGLSGFIFTDFGKEHTIFDDDGEECKPYFIKSIKKISKDGFVYFESFDCHEETKLNLGDNDFVKFSEVEVIPELNDGKPRQIKKISPYSFQIIGEDFSQYPEYISGGIVERIKIPKIIYNRSLKERFNNFYDEKPIEPIDSSKSGRNELLFIIFLALHEYFSRNNSLPELNNKSQVEEIVKKTKELYDELRKKGNLIWLKNIQKWEQKIPEMVASWAKAQISPICSFLGGIVSQEIIKYTGLYIPINQWLIFDFFETVENLGKNVDRQLKNSRYDDQIAIFGNEIQKKIEETNIFLIGAGALGCEYL